MINNNVLDMIGNTPMIKLNNIGNSNLYVKLEKYNPAGSIKDRAVYYMVENLEKNGILKKGDVLVEATSGNTGIALSMIGSLKGYKVIIVMPETMSVERRTLMKAYGAKLILTDGSLGMKGSIEMMNKLLSENTNYISLKQFENEYNPLAHYETTGVEIYNQVKDIDIFVCGVGTGGTISGVGKYLKEQNPNIKVVAVEPEGSPVISKNKKGSHKIQGIGAGFIPKNYNKNVVDEVMTITDEESYEGVRIMAKKEGILVGISSGANIYAALKLCEMYPNKKIVTVVPDGIDKYMSMGIF
ncbi:MAG: cysteine synthase A [Romboutsia timonensis]|uniref:cysteine synthase A n=1 Tax=Romboutsia timonensis TaxID=1776391 RepID=UPI002A754031|nr:cysteine synthase A [Romboutsia timonensis]MDY3002568.1 cysteine synthase A [Romboutsia timonensis]